MCVCIPRVWPPVMARIKGAGVPGTGVTQLGVTLWVVGIEPTSSIRITDALHYRAISPVPHVNVHMLAYDIRKTFCRTMEENVHCRW